MVVFLELFHPLRIICSISTILHCNIAIDPDLSNVCFLIFLLNTPKNEKPRSGAFAPDRGSMQFYTDIQLKCFIRQNGTF